MRSDSYIEQLGPETIGDMEDMIRRNLVVFEESGNIIASIERRLDNLGETYSGAGSVYFIARSQESGNCLGGAGLGTFHGLPLSEKVGEIRDLVVEPDARGQGLGAKLLRRCIDEAVLLGYRRLYLETTPQMIVARKLFLRIGFRPVSEDADSEMPGYFVMENLT